MAESIADKFIRVMGNLKQLDPASDDPMRYAMLGAKQVAENLIYNALQQAQEIIYCAQGMSRDCQEAIKDACAATEPKE